jgi:YD repeat-containing protein
LGYVRDERGIPTRITAEDASYREFVHDALGRQTSETWRNSGGTLVDRKLYFCDPASNRSRVEQDGQPIVYYTYDARNALTRVEPAGGTATVMDYNASGSLVKETTGASVTYFVWTAGRDA